MKRPQKSWREVIKWECGEACREALELTLPHAPVPCQLIEHLPNLYEEIASSGLSYWSWNVNAGMDFGTASLLALDACFRHALSYIAACIAKCGDVSPDDAMLIAIKAQRGWDVNAFLRGLKSDKI